MPPSPSRLPLLLGLSLALAGLSGCRLFQPDRAPDRLDAEDVPRYLERSREDLEEGRNRRALDWMRAASRARGLSTEQRNDVQIVMETAADRRIAELAESGEGAKELAKMLDLDLPRQIAVTAGMQGARLYYERGKRVRAFETIRKVDTRFPNHHERVSAGALLADIGFSLESDPWSLFGTGWFATRDDAYPVLEYLVLHHPWERRSDRAYATLARMYEEDGLWDLAIERHEELILNHPESELRPTSQASVPRLRLRALESPEYDRVALLRALGELEAWLARYPDHPLRREVLLDLGDCLRRLSDSDYVIARFYRTVDNAFGADFHARRAIDFARRAGDDARVTRLEAFRASLAELPELEGRPEILPSANDAPDRFWEERQLGPRPPPEERLEEDLQEVDTP